MRRICSAVVRARCQRNWAQWLQSQAGTLLGCKLRSQASHAADHIDLRADQNQGSHAADHRDRGAEPGFSRCRSQRPQSGSEPGFSRCRSQRPQSGSESGFSRCRSQRPWIRARVLTLQITETADQNQGSHAADHRDRGVDQRWIRVRSCGLGVRSRMNAHSPALTPQIHLSPAPNPSTG